MFRTRNSATLKEVRERATEGDVAWLREHGKVYAALEKV